MNLIQESMKEIQASEELKQNTLQYLEKQRIKQRRFKSRPIPRFAMAIVCLFLVLGAGGYSVYQKPISFISIDVNPSIELGINQFGRVVTVSAYNEDGQNILRKLPLKHISYIQAIDKLLNYENANRFITENSMLFFTIVSDHADKILENISADTILNMYDTMTFTSDVTSMEEAHQHHMSFGKYRAYLELSQYDESVTIDDCHSMTMGEIHHRIIKCKGHTGMTNEEHHSGNGHHERNSD